MSKYKDNKVSVVLCTYNGSKFLNKQLDSILGQSYEVDEIIIVDDCSVDSTREILKEYKERYNKIKLFFNTKNLGSNLSFQYALSLAENEYIVLCDQDDIWFENKIEVQMDMVISSSFYKKEQPLLVFHDLRLIDQHDNVIIDSFWKLHKFKPNNFSFKKLMISNIVTGCTCLINRKTRDEILKCDMNDIIMHDHLIALIAYGFGNVIHIDEQLIDYRSHNNSVTKKENISVIIRIKLFVGKIKSKKYLKPNILQIKKFSDCYAAELNMDKKNVVKNFIELEDSSIIYMLVYRFLVS